MKNWLSKTKTNFVRRPITHFEGITKQPQKPHLKKTMITKLKLLIKKVTQLPKKYIEAKRGVKVFRDEILYYRLTFVFFATKYSTIKMTLCY